MEERKGFFTPEQEKILDDLIELNGIYEALDGPAIKLIDNQGLEALKAKLEEKSPDALPIVFEIVDTIFDALATIADSE